MAHSPSPQTSQLRQFFQIFLDKPPYFLTIFPHAVLIDQTHWSFMAAIWSKYALTVSMAVGKKPSV